MSTVGILLAGVLSGSFITILALRVILAGKLRIDNSDPDDGPYLFLELSKGLRYISLAKCVLLWVETKDYNPRK